jgi:hypothetical protein
MSESLSAALDMRMIRSALVVRLETLAGTRCKLLFDQWKLLVEFGSGRHAGTKCQ